MYFQVLSMMSVFIFWLPPDSGELIYKNEILRLKILFLIDLKMKKQLLVINNLRHLED